MFILIIQIKFMQLDRTSFYQQSHYNPNESVGALNMVNLSTIIQTQNLDYLEHLCAFIQTMNINPLWYQQEYPDNKLKMLEIYQTAITYSHNLAKESSKLIEKQEENIRKKESQLGQMISRIRLHKEDYVKRRQKFKKRKFKLYKVIYDDLKNRIKLEEHKPHSSSRTSRQESEASHEIVYYHPTPPNLPPHLYQHPPMHNQPYYPHPNYHPNIPQNHFNPNMHVPPPSQFYNQRNQIQQNSQVSYLNNGDSSRNSIPPNNYPHPDPYVPASINPQRNPLHPPINPINPILTILSSNNPLSTKINPPPSSPLQNTNQSKINRLQKSIKKQADDEDFLDLNLGDTSNIMKSGKDILKGYEGALNKMQEAQYQSNNTSQNKSTPGESNTNSNMQHMNSIANIRLAKDSTIQPKDPNKPAKFQSNINKNKQEKSTPPSQSLKINITQSKKLQNSYDLKDQINKSNILKSKYVDQQQGGNTNAPKVQKLFSGKPKRNRANDLRKSSVQPEQPQTNNQDSHKDDDDMGFNLNLNSNVRAKKSAIQKQQQNKGKPNGLKDDDLNLNLNLESRFKGKKSTIKQEQSIMESVMGKKSSSRDSEAEPVFPKRPKRNSLIDLNDENGVKTSHNSLKIQLQKSEEMKNEGMFFSQATSVNFNKDGSKALDYRPQNKNLKQEHPKPPPVLEKSHKIEPQQDYQYKQDFDQFDYDGQSLMQSHLPISIKHIPSQTQKKLPLMDKSKVDIDISSFNAIEDSSKYVKLENQTFCYKEDHHGKDILKGPSQDMNKGNTLNHNQQESGDIFDFIQDIPMNSKIAKRPSMIHKFLPSKINKKPIQSLKHLQSSKDLPSQINSGSISIHLIDPIGQDVKLLSKKEQQHDELIKIQEEILNTTKHQMNKGKAFIEKNSLKELPQEEEKNYDEQMDEDLPNSLLSDLQMINLEKSISSMSIDVAQPKPSKDPSNKEKLKKEILELIYTGEHKSKSPVNVDTFKMKALEQLIKQKSKKDDIASLKGQPKWNSIYEVLDDELTQLNKQLEKRRSKMEVQAANPSQHKNYSQINLQYSNSGVKDVKQTSPKVISNAQNLKSIKDMSESITFNDQKPKLQIKNENKYSRSKVGKQKQNTSGMIKGIKQGKNAYDDDPLNEAVYKNANLLKKVQEDDQDFQ